MMVNSTPTRSSTKVGRINAGVELEFTDVFYIILCHSLLLLKVTAIQVSKNFGPVAKLIVTLCYLQSVVFFALEHFKIWYNP